MDLYARLTPVFRDVFDNDDIVLTPQLTADQVDGWDSLGHVRLIVAIEKELGITFSSAEIAGLENVGQMMDLIARKMK